MDPMETPIVGTVKAGDTWHLLSGRVQAFREAWKSGQPPTLADFVPEGAPPYGDWSGWN